MNKSLSRKTGAIDLDELSRKTGLIVRPLDSVALEILFAKLEAYDATERAETLAYLKHALNETRASFGAEPSFLLP
ncbi:MAG TPA: hypothetical protein VNO50_00385 [Pyrinomonadaceae bacterium]|nr:hypothetical protein [Pyrinomonadaceae bacterium]